jgi:hypothetical protein
MTAAGYREQRNINAVWIFCAIRAWPLDMAALSLQWRWNTDAATLFRAVLSGHIVMHLLAIVSRDALRGCLNEPTLDTPTLSQTCACSEPVLRSGTLRFLTVPWPFQLNLFRQETPAPAVLETYYGQHLADGGNAGQPCEKLATEPLGNLGVSLGCALPFPHRSGDGHP